MKNRIKNWAVENIPYETRWKMRDFLPGSYAKKTFSQIGEDRIIEQFFENKDSGFYVDIGAHHPYRWSNTYLMYRKGWCGINIDAMPGSMKRFSRARPRDINLEIPISDTEADLDFYIFNEPALNSFSENLSKDRENKNHSWKIVDTKKLKTSTLAAVLDKFLPNKTRIDFLNVDVEGFDLKVLKSNNWEKYIPTLIIVEILDTRIEHIPRCAIGEYLMSMGYEVHAKLQSSVIFSKR